jgi:hypothetical protein
LISRRRRQFRPKKNVDVLAHGRVNSLQPFARRARPRGRGVVGLNVGAQSFGNYVELNLTVAATISLMICRYTREARPSRQTCV